MITVTAALPGVAIRPAGTDAFNSEAETKVVARGLPFQSTVELLRNALPLAISVKEGPPASVELGLMLLRTGVGLVMVKVRASVELTPFCLTVMLTVPGAAMSAAGTEAVSWLTETKVVVKGVPFHSTTAEETKALPLTVRVKAGPQAGVEAGERLESVAAAGVSLKIEPKLLVPPKFVVP